MRTHLGFLGAALLAASCARDTPHPSGTVAVSSSGPGAPAASASAVAVPSGPSPIDVTNLASGEFQIDVRRPMGVTLVATLERRSDDGGWVPLENLDLGKGYRLVESCAEEAPPSCVSLTPGKPLFPVPWQGFGCSAQCNGTCRANPWEGEGTFHLVVRACDGSASTTGPAFALPPSDTVGPAFERWKATTDVVSATVVRLDPPGGKWNPADPQEASLGGFSIRRGSQVPVGSDVVDGLVKALRDPHGFDDQIEKRCVMGHLVGFRLVRSLPSTGAPRTALADVAVDFVCQKLFVARPGIGGRPATVHATHFDPSRAAFLALVKKALPADAEITALK